VIDPNLKKAVWLTEEQRNQLLDAAARAYATDGADLFACQSVINEIQNIEERVSTWYSKIQAVVRLLELPEDALPIYVSHLEIEEIVVYGELDLKLADFIDPPLPQNNFYDAPEYD
jgi:hypothetical protein